MTKSFIPVRAPKNTEWVTLEVLSAREGGPGYGLISHLQAEGIPARKAPYWGGSTSALVGHVGIQVPKPHEERACKIAFG